MKTNVTTKIKDIKFGAKEDVITLTIDGNITDQQVSILRNIKSTGVAFVSFSSSQLDMDDIEHEKPHQGVRGTIDKDGIAHVDSGQMTLEEAAEAAEDEKGDSDQEQQEDDNLGEEKDEDHVEEQDDEQENLGEQLSGEENGPVIPEDEDDLPF